MSNETVRFAVLHGLRASKAGDTATVLSLMADEVSPRGGTKASQEEFADGHDRTAKVPHRCGSCSRRNGVTGDRA